MDQQASNTCTEPNQPQTESRQPSVERTMMIQPLTNAERQRRYRANHRNQNRPIPLTNAERQRRHRERLRERTAPQQESNMLNVSVPQRDGRAEGNWNLASLHFDKVFYGNPFGFACDVCDRLWFKSDLKRLKEPHSTILEQAFGSSHQSFMLCLNCKQSIDRNKLPQLSTTNGFKYPEIPPGLPELDQISTRLISPRLPFMAIRRLRRDGGYGIIGQVINIPVDVDNMVRQLPRQLDDDYAFNVSIKRKLIHKSSYLSGFVNKRVIKSWLTFLVQQPLYRHYNITIDPNFMQSDQQIYEQTNPQMSNVDMIEDLEIDQIESEGLLARQHTLLWNEEHVLEIAPAQGCSPLNIIFDHFAEELSFPQIYYGVGRVFNPAIRVTPYMIANSEIRRKDRRGVTPEHILYMAMKILRLRVVDGIRNSFRCLRETDNICRRMIEDRRFLEECIERNLSFLKSIPNSINYWTSRKKDLFNMMRQLGKPSAFLTISASEVKWPHLLNLLYKLRHNGENIDPSHILDTLDRSACANLVNEDPVACCVYFNKLVDVIMSMIRSNKRHNPFGKYRVIDHFLRIEFQHRGSPHAHILLWLENDPREQISENMPLTLQLVTDLCSVSESDLPDNMYQNQVHRHTFTCTKRGETSCRFNIPFWPMRISRVLLPLPNNLDRIRDLRNMAKKAKHLLETKVYQTIDQFMTDIGADEISYLDIVRSTLTKPTICFKRNMSQIMTNTFHPWIGRILNSNMDLQFILDEYSCAQYVVDYVNKSNRGTSNLHRELVKLNEQHPELTHESLLRKLGSKILNTVELSAQEAAWYLLRQNMSHCSRDVVFIPTMWPCERQKSYKTKAQMDRANLSPDSTDIWTKSIIQKYEERPDEMDALCLADYAAWITPKARITTSEEDLELEELSEVVEPRAVARASSFYHRQFARIISFRGYDNCDVNNFKREMVTLFVPFRNEQVEVIDRNKFLEIYQSKMQDIAAKKIEYLSGFDLEQVLEEIRQAQNQPEERPTVDVIMQRDNFAREVLTDGDRENFDDFNIDQQGSTVSAIRTRINVMTKEQYCSMMRTTNQRQRELLLEFIHRLNTPSSPQIRIFFTGPAGCGKTYVLKLIMETLNRYSQNQNCRSNAYVACASTGKASVGIAGTTVHSAFHITQSRNQGPIARESLHNFRQLFANVRCVIIDEVSMIGNDILHKVNQRLQQITGELEENYGGLDMVFCGDFRQLPPVNATPVYKGSRNHLEGALLWQSLDFFGLDEVMRQSDIVFSTILTKIGEGSPLAQCESQLIESRFRSEQWCDENLIGVVRLYHRNHMVDSYNSRVIANAQELVAHDEIIGYSNNDEVVAARTKLHRMSTMETGGLPYSIKLAAGYPYMLTSNSDIEDGLVNGAIGTLQFIEHMVPNDQENNSQRIRVWLEFPDDRIGTNARLKARPIVVSHRGQIHLKWTPIAMKSASINLGRTVRCKRSQLPLTPACAMTIHKSQGGTFDKAVVLYEKSQQNQLVYVALSRVKSIDGLYLINPKNEFIFHHKSGSTAPSIKEIRDEYARLMTHPLETISKSIDEFINADHSRDTSLIICTINSQSLVAHSVDISTDKLITKSDMLVITETWVPEDTRIDIDGYILVASSNCSATAQSSSAQYQIAQQTRRTAGGVAIYRKVDRPIQCHPITFNPSSMRRVLDTTVGDISFIDMIIDGSIKVVLVATYIHPGVSKTNIEMFLFYALANYCSATRSLFPESEVDLETPLVLTGDFNTNVLDNDWIVELMRQTFGLEYVRCIKPTTLGNTIIDLTFVRGVSASCLPFVSYFSYHRPLFNKITFNQ